MPPVAFAKISAAPIRFDKKLGRAVGWACFSKKAGEEYVDLHGDHFPDDELFKAVDALMKLPVEKRELNVEHAGAARGTIVTAFALGEDIAKSLTCDTGGNYGVLASVEPDAALLKSIEAGELLCWSIEGLAHDVETITKSAGADIAATKHKRTMRKVELTKLALVKAGAHEGAGVTLLKSAEPPAGAMADVMSGTGGHAILRSLLLQVPAPVAKRTPAMTSPHDGHQHLIGDVEERDGFTSWETASNDPYGHSHPWVRTDTGITIGEANGHSHTLETSTMPTEIEKAQADVTAARTEIAKRDTRITTLAAALLVACSLPPEQAAYAKRLPESEREGFLAKSVDERTKLATPIHKSERTARVFYAGEESLAEMAKDNDAMHAKVEKAEAATATATFEKRVATELPHLRGTVAERAAVLKAVEGIPDEAQRKVALEMLKSADAAMAPLFKAQGHGGGHLPAAGDGAPGTGGELGQIALQIQKDLGGEAKCSFAKAYDMALDTPRGRVLYAEDDAANRQSGPGN